MFEGILSKYKEFANGVPYWMLAIAFIVVLIIILTSPKRHFDETVQSITTTMAPIISTMNPEPTQQDLIGTSTRTIPNPTVEDSFIGYNDYYAIQETTPPLYKDYRGLEETNDMLDPYHISDYQDISNYKLLSI